MDIIKTVFWRSTLRTSKEFPAWSLPCPGVQGRLGGLQDEVCTRWSRVQYCALWPGALEGSCRLQLGNLPQYRSGRTTNWWRNKIVVARAGGGRPDLHSGAQLTQFPARAAVTLALFNFTLIQTVMNMHKQTSCFCLHQKFWHSYSKILSIKLPNCTLVKVLQTNLPILLWRQPGKWKKVSILKNPSWDASVRQGSVCFVLLSIKITPSHSSVYFLSC